VLFVVRLADIACTAGVGLVGVQSPRFLTTRPSQVPRVATYCGGGSLACKMGLGAERKVPLFHREADVTD
jgi:hypothetical protein